MGAAGFLLGIGLWYIIGTGFFYPWEKLPAPPPRTSELIAAPGESPYIKTSDGSTYTYSDWQNEGWIQGTLQQDAYSGPFDITNPCDLTSSEFSQLLSRPQTIKDCYQETIGYPDGASQFTFVLDKNGYVWEWADKFSEYETLFSVFGWICFSSTGLLIGVVIALLAKKANHVE